MNWMGNWFGPVTALVGAELAVTVATSAALAVTVTTTGELTAEIVP